MLARGNILIISPFDIVRLATLFRASRSYNKRMLQTASECYVESFDKYYYCYCRSNVCVNLTSGKHINKLRERYVEN